MPELLNQSSANLMAGATSASDAVPPRKRASRPPLGSQWFTARRVADKVQRKLGKLRGRPDNSPWIVRPAGAPGTKTYVDFLFGVDYLSPNSELIRIFREVFAPYGLSFLLVNEKNLEPAIADVARGWLRPYVYLDLCSAVDARFLDLLEACATQGIHTVGDPRILPTWTIKAESHPRLEKAGLPLPETVILKRDEPDRELTTEERARIGERCVVKPSFGVAGKGAVVGIPPTAAAISAARDFNRKDDWLIQQMITWGSYDNHPAYLRAYNVLGHRSLLWWAKIDGIDMYHPLTWADLKKYDLLGAVELIDRVAEVSGMEFFSSEIAITSDSGPRRFVLIDYINDQCDMDPEPGPGKRAVPEEWVRWTCGRFAELAWRIKHGLARDQTRTLSLLEARPVASAG